MSRPILEVIALDADDARAAQAGGADRLELVTDMAADGLTPSLETFARIRAAVDIPLRVMLRAGDGFASGGPAALDALAVRARALRAAGAEEFVLGFLDADGLPDLAAVRTLTEAVPGCPWTFHRAVDHAADRDVLRKRLAGAVGLDTFLTAGSARGVADGLDVLRAETARTAAGDPGYGQRLMVGGGLRLEHVEPLRAAGVDAFHIGGAARPAGWTTPVHPDLVRTWRTGVDTEPAPTIPA
jgi:copper homeostasis protein